MLLCVTHTHLSANACEKNNKRLGEFTKNELRLLIILFIFMCCLCCFSAPFTNGIMQIIKGEN